VSKVLLVVMGHKSDLSQGFPVLFFSDAKDRFDDFIWLIDKPFRSLFILSLITEGEFS
jgi:hypothetical protein